jgi:light-regulated signal transduction histidine kinase (bacteriophytochrome)
MKLETKKQIEFATNSSFESIDATISSTDMHKLWDMLQNPYKDNISSIVREITSNGFDSMAEAMFIKEHSLEEIRKEYGIYNTVSDEELLLLKKHVSECNNDAVAVSVEKDETGWYWSTEDIGVGLSPSRVRTVFVNYLKSTKELSNTMIGALNIPSVR